MVGGHAISGDKIKALTRPYLIYLGEMQQRKTYPLIDKHEVQHDEHEVHHEAKRLLQSSTTTPRIRDEYPENKGHRLSETHPLYSRSPWKCQSEDSFSNRPNVLSMRFHPISIPPKKLCFFTPS
jgi:hypothetical protein